MFLKSLLQLLKAQRLPIVIGLLIILLVKMRAKANNQKASLFNRQVISDSKYFAYSDFILAQAKHESANFTSAVYRANNNPFGMKVPSVRKFLGTTGTKANDGGYYARYENDTIAFKDFLLWLSARRIPTGLSLEGYVNAIHAKGYFTDSVSNYLNALKLWLKK